MILSYIFDFKKIIKEKLRLNYSNILNYFKYLNWLEYLLVEGLLAFKKRGTAGIEPATYHRTELWAFKRETSNPTLAGEIH